ncbi:F-box protein GID2-like [Macadamia integrifolia]|uniref:F-box protein GID2-like n=1 Tax=Macadamia integrifolia TaxID=60698 RepID=UPI001C4EF88F|nr:F-box protein GID2-like [Macadamia integrifolia]
MKRELDPKENPAVDAEKKKKMKGDLEEEQQREETGFVHLNGDLLFEVLKHVDARSLAKAACVNKQWNQTARDERLWEMICTRHWANTGGGPQRLRSVLLSLGGFRGLHSQCLLPLLKPPSLPSSSSSSSSSSLSLPLSLLSIRHFEKMNANHTGGR